MEKISYDDLPETKPGQETSAEQPVPFLEFMSLVAECTPEKIARFRSTLIPEDQAYFDTVPANYQTLITSIDEMKPEDLEVLRGSVASHAPAIHSLHGLLAIHQSFVKSEPAIRREAETLSPPPSDPQI